MVSLDKNLGKIPDQEVTIYLKDSWKFEIACSLTYILESLVTLIAGYLIIMYS